MRLVLLMLILTSLACPLRGATGGTGGSGTVTTNSFNTNQFITGSIISIEDGARLTNIQHEGTLELTNGSLSGVLRLRNAAGGFLSFQIPPTFVPSNKISLSITNAAVGDVLKLSSVASSGGIHSLTMTNGPDSGLPGGNAADIQFNHGGAFAGTNTFIYDRTNNQVLLEGSGAENSTTRPRFVATNSTATFSIEYNSSGISVRNQSALQFNWGDASTGWGTNLLNLSPSGGLTPAIARSLQLGTPTSPYVQASMVESVLSPTNVQAVVVKAANSNSVPVTKIVGLIERGSTSPMIIDCNLAHNVTSTNRVTGVVTVVWTNTAPGQEYTLTIPGEIAGGTSRVITLVPTLGDLVANLSVFGTALAPTGSFTLTNGNAAQIDVRMSKYHTGSTAATNIFAFTVRQYSF